MDDSGHTSPGEIETGTAGRACDACHKKKTKCDMQQPVCGLCRRTGKECHFPSTRKRPSRQDPSTRAKLQKVNGNLDRLVELLEANPDIERETLRGLLDNKDRSNSVDKPSSTDISTDQSPKSKNSAQKKGDGVAVSAKAKNVSSSSSNTFPISYELATHLIDLFFSHVQTWLPIFHKPTFLEWSHGILCQGENAMANLTLSELVMFNAIFALSARFSNHALLASLQPRERGEKFIKSTEHWFRIVRDTDDLEMTFLKACVLLAWYHYAAGNTRRGWYITHMCIRGCYDFGLNQIDEGPDDEEITDEEWVQKESLRRTFWLVLEIDSFGSIIKRKPFAIDYRHVHVKMPVSDEAWFAGQQVESAKFIYGADNWKTLVGNPNQNERAWSIIAKSTVGLVFDLMLYKQGVTNEQLSTVESSLSCLKLAMPESMQLTSPTWQAPDIMPARKNWVIAANLYLATASFVLTRIPIIGHLPSPKEEFDSRETTLYTNRVSEVNEILKRWPADAILVAHPCLSGTILTYDESMVNLLPHTGTVAAYRDLSKLILGKFAERWQLGAVLLRVRNLAHNYYTSDEDTKAELVRQYPIYFDRETRKHRKSVTDDTQKIWTPSAPSPANSTTTRRSIDQSHSPDAMLQQSQNPIFPQSQTPQQMTPAQPVLMPQQQQLSNFDTANGMANFYDPNAKFGDMTNFQDFSSFSNVSQSPEDIDALFSGFLQEPWWQDSSAFNFVV